MRSYYFILESHLRRRMKNATEPMYLSLLSGIGWGNGYVLVDKSHEWYGVHYDSINADAHGGLTLSENFNSIDIDDWFADCEFKLSNDMDEIVKSNGYKAFDNYWLIGFDTGHAGDGPHIDKEYVWNETEKLYKQYIEASNVSQRKKKLKNIKKLLQKKE